MLDTIFNFYVSYNLISRALMTIAMRAGKCNASPDWITIEVCNALFMISMWWILHTY